MRKLELNFAPMSPISPEKGDFRPEIQLALLPFAHSAMNPDEVPRILLLECGTDVQEALESGSAVDPLCLSARDVTDASDRVEQGILAGQRVAAVLLEGPRHLALAAAIRQRDPEILVVLLAVPDPGLAALVAAVGIPDTDWAVLRSPLDRTEARQLFRNLASRGKLGRELRDQSSLVEHRVAGRTADLERMNRDLALARDSAEAASRIKSEFLANMSHEIRTPMYGVLGMTDLLLETGMTEVQKDYVVSVRKSGSMLLNILNDILDFSKIEAGKMELDPSPFELRDALGDALRMLGLKAGEQRVELLCSVDPEVPDSLLGDSLRIRQVVTNLVTNGIKFTEKGEVEVAVRLEGEPVRPGEVVLHFSVRDTGIGIPAEKQPSIFSAFTQADTSTTRRYGGTGLGLTICRSLVEMMGGRIWFESEVGRGSTFHFVLPFGRILTGAPPKVETAELAGLSALIIDDNATNRRILGDMVRQWRMEPTLAENGPDGLAALRIGLERGRRHDLILLDCNMPEMDGFAVAAAIRQLPGVSACTILMLTSVDRTGDAQRSRELGLAAYLIKPISQSELLREIRRIVGAVRRVSGTSDESMPGVASRRARRLRVMVVDDVAVNRRIAQAKIEKLGHTVVLAEGGRQAVELYSTQAFDLAFMDIQMPEMDGFEATSRIREVQRRTGVHVPVVAMTAMAMKGDREKCLAAGLDDYISKPIEAGALERVLSSVESSEAAGSQEPEPEPEPEPKPVSGAPGPVSDPGRGAFDPRVALPRCMGEESLLLELLSVYLADCEGYLIHLRQAWEAGDPVRFARATHKIKGAISYFCSDELAAEARGIEETAAKQGMAACACRLEAFQSDVLRLNREASEFLRGKSR
jgi:signal transduction histidine kinase/CheY-like chemotaxis protein